MKFSGKICFEIILRVTKNQGFTPSLEDTFFEKPQAGEDGGDQFDPPRHIRLKDRVPYGLVSGVVYEYMCGRCNYSYYVETERQLKVRSGEYIGI